MQGQLAPNFELQDTFKRVHRLSDYRSQKIVVLAFLRGFM